EYLYGENRYRALTKFNPEAAAALLASAKTDVADRFELMQQLADMKCPLRPRSEASKECSDDK
ncbi:MAG: hypothetical protein JW804_05155, partial [Sedimentisphaerales bacterium]|nr:hypothetical protein [Sedimentisphaerales bacterium]